jgi:hypothetical protein
MTRIKKGIDRKYSVLAAKAVFRLCTFAMVRYLDRHCGIGVSFQAALSFVGDAF